MLIKHAIKFAVTKLTVVLYLLAYYHCLEINGIDEIVEQHLLIALHKAGITSAGNTIAINLARSKHINNYKLNVA